MPAVYCQCVRCGVPYYTRGDETAILPSMRPSRKELRPGDPLRTWLDWVWHIQTHCPDCRFAVPPPECRKDLEKHAAQHRRDRGE